MDSTWTPTTHAGWVSLEASLVGQNHSEHTSGSLVSPSHTQKSSGHQGEFLFTGINRGSGFVAHYPSTFVFFRAQLLVTFHWGCEKYDFDSEWALPSTTPTHFQKSWKQEKKSRAGGLRK